MTYSAMRIDELDTDSLLLSNGQTLREFLLAEGCYIRTARVLNDILASRGMERLSEEELLAAKKPGREDRRETVGV